MNDCIPFCSCAGETEWEELDKEFVTLGKQVKGSVLKGSLGGTLLMISGHSSWSIAYS